MMCPENWEWIFEIPTGLVQLEAHANGEVVS